MWILVNGKKATEIDTESAKKLLDVYPEEKLIRRPIFEDAFRTNTISFKKLKKECETIILPWQLFFLNKNNLIEALKHIDENRADKISPKIFSKRKGHGKTVSKRIIDRLIRLQNFINDYDTDLSVNNFCGSMAKMTNLEAANYFIEYFEIDDNKIQNIKTKKEALDYLISKIENKQINVCQGTTAHKLLPANRVVGGIYKEISGFVIKDKNIPFVFLPGGINNDEFPGRQIYTLIYLILLIGFDEYDLTIDVSLNEGELRTLESKNRINKITSEILIPSSDTTTLSGKKITLSMISDLSTKYKITPTAVLFNLKERKIIKEHEYNNLLSEIPPSPAKNNQAHTPNIETSIKKLCGKYSFNIINKAVKSESIKNIQAQYLIFGGVNKAGYKKYQIFLNK